MSVPVVAGDDVSLVSSWPAWARDVLVLGGTTPLWGLVMPERLSSCVAP